MELVRVIHRVKTKSKVDITDQSEVTLNIISEIVSYLLLVFKDQFDITNMQNLGKCIDEMFTKDKSMKIGDYELMITEYINLKKEKSLGLKITASLKGSKILKLKYKEYMEKIKSKNNGRNSREGYVIYLENNGRNFQDKFITFEDFIQNIKNICLAYNKEFQVNKVSKKRYNVIIELPIT